MTWCSPRLKFWLSIPSWRERAVTVVSRKNSVMITTMFVICFTVWLKRTERDWYEEKDMMKGGVLFFLASSVSVSDVTERGWYDMIWWCQRHKRCLSMYYAAKWNLRGHSLDFPTNTRSMAFIHIILFSIFTHSYNRSSFKVYVLICYFLQSLMIVLVFTWNFTSSWT